MVGVNAIYIVMMPNDSGLDAAAYASLRWYSICISITPPL